MSDNGTMRSGVGSGNWGSDEYHLREDLAMMRSALRGGWPVSMELRERAVAAIDNILNNPETSQRNRIAAVKTLASIMTVNVGAYSAMVREKGLHTAAQVAVTMTNDRDREILQTLIQNPEVADIAGQLSQKLTQLNYEQEVKAVDELLRKVCTDAGSAQSREWVADTDGYALAEYGAMGRITLRRVEDGRRVPILTAFSRADSVFPVRVSADCFGEEAESAANLAELEALLVRVFMSPEVVKLVKGEA